jgi:hypothetical protein
MHIMQEVIKKHDYQLKPQSLKTPDTSGQANIQQNCCPNLKPNAVASHLLKLLKTPLDKIPKTKERALRL